MRSLDETKASLKGCMMKLVFPRLENCRMCMFFKTEHCDGERHAQALAYIERLEAERDAAVMDLKMYTGCIVCKYEAVAGLDDCSGCGYENEMFEWRGVCDDNSGKDANVHG